MRQDATAYTTADEGFPKAAPAGGQTAKPRTHKRVITSAAGAAWIDASADAVVVTPALLDALRGRPLPAAARAIGLSATAFKRACRRLGVARWAFHRGVGRKLLTASGALRQHEA